MKKTHGKKSFSFPDWPSLGGGLGGASAMQRSMNDYQSYVDKMTRQMLALSPIPTIAPATPKPPSVDAAKLELLKTADAYKITARMPDYVNVLTGWRAWCVVNRDGWKLQALGKEHVWQPKKAMEAVCAKDRSAMFAQMLAPPSSPETSHPAPQMSCTCGVWAFKSLDNLVAAIGSDYDQVKVLGQVSLWGRVIETENGYRAEKAYPSELWLLDPSLEKLGLIYDVPVRIAQ